MKVVDNLTSFKKPDFSVVTIGTFDGVHRGHQIVLSKVVDAAVSNKGKSILITFWPHPRFILRPNDNSLKLLSTFIEKKRLIDKIGFDYVIKLTFTSEFSHLSAEQFLSNILIDKIGTKKLFIGYDHHFGNKREGNIDFLQNKSDLYGFSVVEIPRQDIDNIGVSSTKIRNALYIGKIALANTLLGRNYSIEGKVVHGEKKGRSIGFPTANVQIKETFKLLPRDGVYAVRVRRSFHEYLGMLNIGFRPTLEGSQRSIEVHLFNFDEELYGELLTIEFIEFIREEQKFNSLDQLRKQLNKDKQKTLEILP
ncbi:MAG: bifunctional riboflavin kinase/FAD synthetase [Bacteroidota bacterium]